jgi:aminopeptidase N
MRMTVRYRVNQPTQGLHFFGPTANEPDVARVMWSQGESTTNSYWFPCFDHPNELQTTELIVTADEAYKISSNGRLVSRRESDHGSGMTWHYLQDQPHAAYLVSLVVGEFHVVDDIWEGVPIEYWVHPPYAEQAQRSFANTKRMLSFFSERIGVKYPWDRYAQLACEGFGGGMENTSVTTLGLSALHDDRSILDGNSDDLLAHELAHQWWGDLLTCRDWAHLWLNEGFATYFEALWGEFDLGADEFSYDMDRKARRAREGGRERPIVDRRYDDPGSMFDSRAYPKGAWVLHMLRRRLGDEVFWHVLQRYAADYAHRPVETVDLRKTFEDVTGRSFERFFYDWTERPGHPVVDVAFDWMADDRLARLTIAQTQEGEPFHFPLRIELQDADGGPALVRELEITDQQHTLFLPLDRAPSLVRVDPAQAVLAEFKEKKSRALWEAQLRNDPSVALRLRAVSHFADSRRPEDQALLATALADDPFWGVRDEAAGALGKLGGDVARQALISGLSAENPRVRRACAEALGEFRGDEQAAAALRPLVTQGDASYQAEAAAIASYVKIGAGDALAQVHEVLKRDSRNEVLRSAALRHLGPLEDPQVVDLLITWSRPDRPRRCRPEALSALAEATRHHPTDEATYQRIVEALAAGLEDSGRQVRSAAARALGNLQEPRRAESTLPALQQLAAHDSERRVRSAAEAAVKAIREGRQAPVELSDLRKELEAAVEHNKELESRLEKLEQLRREGAAPPGESAGASAGPGETPGD